MAIHSAAPALDPASPSSALPQDLSDRLKSAAGPGGWSEDPARLEPKLIEWRGRWRGTTPLLLLPKTVGAVSAILKICAETRTPVTPQGGNTGLVGGQIPQGEVLLSLERMAAVRDIDVEDNIVVVEAGATLAAVHAAAEAVDRRFPLSLASEGSCTVGGLISTNAGGTAVLRYGSMRALTLGLEAVFADGAVHHGLKRLRKDNTGYDLKQFFIGAEGTLGVVTAASLKLFPRLLDRCVAFAAVATPQAAVTLLGRAQSLSGGAVEAFELINRQGMTFALKRLPGARDPLEVPSPYVVLIELAGADAGAAARGMERLLGAAIEEGLVQDAAIAQSESQAKAFWALREGQSAAQRAEGAAWKHDVATPVSRIADFIDAASAAVLALSPEARIVAFGHLGDGNIHFDVVKPTGSGDAEHERLRTDAARRIHDIAADLGGTISAEHGLGAAKSEEALRYKSPQDVAAMRAIRAALDPRRIMNPRVLF
jgi:FAD/FMN-containing dehydrogenase